MPAEGRAVARLIPVAALLCLATSLPAQSPTAAADTGARPDSVSLVGRRIRLTFGDASGAAPIMGRLRERSAGNVVVDAGRRAWTIQTRTIATAEVAERRPRFASAAIGLTTGAVVGRMVGSLSGPLLRKRRSNPWPALIVGAGAGAWFGAARGGEAWVSIPLDRLAGDGR